MPNGAGWYVFAVDIDGARESTDEEDRIVNRFRFGLKTLSDGPPHLGFFLEIAPEGAVKTMELRENLNRWLPIAFAFVVSEVVPMSSLVQLRQSLQQISNWKLGLGLPEHYVRGMLALTVGYFPVLATFILLAAFCAYLAVTRTLTLRGFLCGFPTGFFVFSLGFMGVIALFVFSALHVPQPIFYYLILRLPIFFGLAFALLVAGHFHSSIRTPSPQPARA